MMTLFYGTSSKVNQFAASLVDLFFQSLKICSLCLFIYRLVYFVCLFIDLFIINFVYSSHLHRPLMPVISFVDLISCVLLG